MRKLLLSLATLFMLSLAVGTPTMAQGATTNLSIIINSPPSTTVTCTLGTYTAPLAAGSVICPITVTPSGWSGALTLSGTSASSFALSGSNLVVGSSALNAGTYSVTITATP